MNPQFWTAPLHLDTSYFVPPSIVARRRFAWRGNWNAWAQGCSKTLPTVFYSLAYLAAGPRYKTAFRAAYAGLVLTVAAWLAYSVGIWVGVAFALLLSEPHRGAYYESSEAISVLVQATAFGLLLSGHPWGLALLTLDVLFVKPSGIPLLGLAWIAQIITGGWSWLAFGLSAGVGVAFMAWVAYCGGKPREMLKVLRVQQNAISRGLTFRQRLAEKARMLWDQTISNPSMTLCALLAVFCMHGSSQRWLAFSMTLLVGSLASYLWQGNRVWYYSIPLALPIAVFAGLGMTAAGWIAPLTILLWTYFSVVVPLRLTPTDRHLWMWKLHNEGGQAVKNMAIETALPTLRAEIGNSSVYIFGHETQLYAQLGTAYETPWVSTAWFIDYLRPGWRTELARLMVKSPPTYLVDTLGGLDTEALEQSLGLRYDRRYHFLGTLDLYRFRGQEVLVTAIVSAYYCRQWLPGRLENLWRQTIKPQIIVVAEAGSEEATIAAGYLDFAHGDKLIETGRVPTIYEAWNRGVKLAHGRYITNANADDLLRDDALEVLANALTEHPEAGVAYADVDIVQGLTGGFLNAKRTGYFRWAEGGHRELLQSCFLGPQPMWRRSLHDEHGMFDGTMKSAGDYEMWLRFAKGGVKFRHIHQVLGVYLDRPDSAGHQEIANAETLEARRRHECL